MQGRDLRKQAQHRFSKLFWVALGTQPYEIENEWWQKSSNQGADIRLDRQARSKKTSELGKLKRNGADGYDWALELYRGKPKHDMNP